MSWVMAIERASRAHYMAAGIACTPNIDLEGSACAILAAKQTEETMPAAFFVVRATVKDPAKRKAFDTWYQNEHLPDAAKCFGVVKAWGFWSLTDPSLHQATYQFADEASLDRAMKGEDLKRLVA